VIRGGVQINQVPENCEIEVDRRLLPGESASAGLARYEQLLQELAMRHTGFRAEVVQPPLLVDEALETAADAGVVRCAQHCLREMGLADELCGVPFGSDASKLSRAGVPTIIFGPGSIDQAHAVEEYVELEQLRSATEFYTRFIQNYGR
jgi:acetylornithine deacetylase/succinyl-diaminopimelate desuccinylase-like protein